MKPIHAGELIVLTDGSYSDYHMHFVAVALRGFDLAEACERYLTHFPEQRKRYGADTTQFGWWLITEGYLEEKAARELWFGEYSNLGEANINAITHEEPRKK